jgi:hypothetical protein
MAIGTLKFVRRLEAAGVSSRQAEARAKAFQEALEIAAVTKLTLLTSTLYTHRNGGPARKVRFALLDDWFQSRTHRSDNCQDAYCALSERCS